MISGDKMIKFNKINFKKIKQRLPLTSQIFSRYSEEIIAVYLFGSLVKDNIKPLSDIDLAILFNFKLTQTVMVDLENRIFIELIRFLETEEIDGIVLNYQPISRQFAVLKNKQILYCSDHKKRIDFETGVILSYLDFKPYREEFNREFVRALGGR